MSEQQRWTELGNAHPFWAVLTDERYRADRIQPSDVLDFYDTGEAEIAATLAVIRRVAAPEFSPAVSVDYGSGVGRLTFPIARVSGRAIGVDISPPMLDEARRHASEMKIGNAEFVHVDEFLAADDARYPLDFVHSYIVFQHVPPRIGMRVTEVLLRRLRPGGVAALHYAYGRRASLLRRAIHQTRKVLPPVNVLVNLVQRRPALEPMIPMHQYDTSALLALFQAHGAREIHVLPTEHGGHLGAMFIFARAAATADRR